MEPVLRTLRKHWLLVSQLFQNLSGTGESITWLTDADVQNKLLNAGRAHWVVFLSLLVVGFDLQR